MANAHRIIARFGSLRLSNLTQHGIQIRTLAAENIIIHPKYSPEHFESDIALVKIPEPVEYSKEVKPIQLPRTCDSNEKIHVIAVGHGPNKSNKEFSDILRWAPLETIPRKKCTNAYPIFLLSQGMICAKSFGKQSICKNDNGGALLRRKDKTLIGIAQYMNENIGALGLPQTFTNITPYLSWISHYTGLILPNCEY